MDPVADLLTILRNGYLAKKEQVYVPYSKIKEALTKIIAKHGFVQDYQVKDAKDIVNKKLVINLNYPSGIPAITKVKRISKSSVRIYTNKKNIPSSLSGAGITILSTSKGLLTDKEARKKGLGGEIICQIY